MVWTRSLRDVKLEDIALVGGKNASLGEMLRELVPLGVKVPDGFAVTAEAYRYFIERAGLEEAIAQELNDIDKSKVDDLIRRANRLRDRIAHAPMPTDLRNEIEDHYLALSREYGEDATDVAVRSSATAEDLPNASFAGQQESFLNVRGAPFVVEAVRKAFASLFTPRAISYRDRHGLRPHASRAVGRRAEDGALRPRERRRHLHARPRDRASRRRPRHRRAAASGRASCRAGSSPTSSSCTRRRCGRASRRSCGRSSERRRSASSTTRAATSRCRTSASPMPIARASRSTTTTCSRSPRWAVADRGALLERARRRHADGHRVGQGRRERRALHRAGSARDRAQPPRRTRSSASTR